MQALTWMYADDTTRAEEGRQWGAWAIELLSRIPHSDRELSRVYNRLGWSYVRAGKPQEAEPYLRRALSLGDSVGGPDSMESILALNGLGVALTDRNRLPEALALYERLGATMLRVWGPEHPRTAILYGNLGRLHASLGNGDKALEYAERTLALFRASLSPKHPNLARAELNIGGALLVLERYPEALTHLQASVALFEASLGPKSPELVDALWAMATTLVELLRPAEALPHALRAVTLAQSEPGTPLGGMAGSRLGLVQLALGRPAEALPVLQQAVKSLEALKETAAAGDMAYARFLLARAEWELGRDRAGALQRVAQARAQMEAPGDGWNRKQVDGWLALHAAR